MAQAARRLTFEEYLNLDAENWVRLGLPEGMCEFVDGEVVELPPELGLNDAIANFLFFMLVSAGKYALVGTGSDSIVSPTFRDLQLTAEQILAAGR